MITTNNIRTQNSVKLFRQFHTFESVLNASNRTEPRSDKNIQEESKTSDRAIPFGAPRSACSNRISLFSSTEAGKTETRKKAESTDTARKRRSTSKDRRGAQSKTGGAVDYYLEPLTRRNTDTGALKIAISNTPSIHRRGWRRGRVVAGTHTARHR